MGTVGYASTSPTWPNIHATKVAIAINAIEMTNARKAASVRANVFCCGITQNVIPQQDQYCLHLAKTRRKVETGGYPNSHITQFRSMAPGLVDQQFQSYKDMKKLFGSRITFKDENFCRNGIWHLPEISEKNMGVDVNILNFHFQFHFRNNVALSWKNSKTWLHAI